MYLVYVPKIIIIIIMLIMMCADQKRNTLKLMCVRGVCARVLFVLILFVFGLMGVVCMSSSSSSAA